MLSSPEAPGLSGAAMVAHIVDTVSHRSVDAVKLFDVTPVL